MYPYLRKHFPVIHKRGYLMTRWVHPSIVCHRKIWGEEYFAFDCSEFVFIACSLSPPPHLCFFHIDFPIVILFTLGDSDYCEIFILLLFGRSMDKQQCLRLEVVGIFSYFSNFLIDNSKRRTNKDQDEYEKYQEEVKRRGGIKW